MCAIQECPSPPPLYTEWATFQHLQNTRSDPTNTTWQGQQTVARNLAALTIQALVRGGLVRKRAAAAAARRKTDAKAKTHNSTKGTQKSPTTIRRTCCCVDSMSSSTSCTSSPSSHRGSSSSRSNGRSENIHSVSFPETPPAPHRTVTKLATPISLVFPPSSPPPPQTTIPFTQVPVQVLPTSSPCFSSFPPLPSLPRRRFLSTDGCMIGTTGREGGKGDEGTEGDRDKGRRETRGRGERQRGGKKKDGHSPLLFHSLRPVAATPLGNKAPSLPRPSTSSSSRKSSSVRGASPVERPSPLPRASTRPYTASIMSSNNGSSSSSKGGRNQMPPSSEVSTTRAPTTRRERLRHSLFQKESRWEEEANCKEWTGKAESEMSSMTRLN